MHKKTTSLDLSRILKAQIIAFIFIFTTVAFVHYYDGFFDGVFLPLALIVFLAIFFLFVFFISDDTKIYLNFFVLLLVLIFYLFLQKSQTSGFDIWRLNASGFIPILGFWLFSPYLVLIIGTISLIGLEFIYFSNESFYFHLLVWIYFLILYLASFGLFYFDRLYLKYKAVASQKNNLEDIYTTEFFRKYLKSEFARLKTLRKQSYFICIDFVQDSEKLNRRELVFYLHSVKNLIKRNELIFKLKRNKLIIAVVGKSKGQVFERKEELKTNLFKSIKKEKNFLFNTVQLNYTEQDIESFINKIYSCAD